MDIEFLCRVEEKIRNLETKIMNFIEESIISGSEGKVKEGIDKAKEAVSRERTLFRLQDQAGLTDSQNTELSFAVHIII